MRRVLTASVPLLFVSQLLAAQVASPLGGVAPGARVRISTAGQPRRVATFLGRHADSIIVRWAASSDDSVVVPLTGISRLEVSGGRHRPVLRNAGYGTLIGGVAGAIIGVASYTPCTDTGFLACLMVPESRGEAGAWGAAAGGTVGLIAGALSGIPRRERWHRVEKPADPVAVSIAPSPHGVRLRVAARF